MTDFELLQRYVRDGAEEAFAALVRRHVDLVYSAARRQVSVPHLAEDVTQAVFVELAHQAPRWRATQPVGAWLYVVTRRTAIDAMRRESRRAAREFAAVAPPVMPATEDPWNEIRPLLDAAMASLGEHDRNAIVARFFENKSFREVAGELGASEDAAQKRVARAVDRLRAFFSARGVSLTAGSLTATLSTQAVQPAPAAFVAHFATSGGIASALATAAASGAKISLPKIATALGFVGASAAAILLAIVLARQHAALGETRIALAAAETRVDALRRARDADLEQLRAAQAAGLSVAPDPDAALRAEIRAWTGRVAHLQKIMRQRPDLALPEMALLTDEDWRIATRERTFTTDQDVGATILALRGHARAALGFKLMAALENYLNAHDETLPPTVLALAPYFRPPIDPAILARYEMLHQGKLSAVPPLDPADERHASHSGSSRDDLAADAPRAAVIGERRELLLPDDGRLKVGPQSYAVVDDLAASLEPFEGRAEKAALAYIRAHGGAMPQQPAELLPYFNPPLNPTEQQHMMTLLRLAERRHEQTLFRDLKP